MPQSKLSAQVEPLMLERQTLSFDGTSIAGTLFDARYDYQERCFTGYATDPQGCVQHIRHTIAEPHVIAATIADWIHGWISTSQRTELYNRAKACPADQAIVEIGSWKGKSTVILGWGSKAGNRAPVWAIDPHQATPLFWDIHTGGQPDSTRDQFLANIHAAGVEDVVYPLVESATAAAQAFALPVGLLFVDGDHMYAPFDVRDWWPHVVLGGWVLLHDSNMAAVSATVRMLQDNDRVSYLSYADNMAIIQKAS